jgi:tetratricopeptide (TPR) repeat protein
MSRKSTNPFAITLRIVLDIVLVVALGLLLGLLTGYGPFLEWLKAHTWYSTQTLALAITTVIVVTIIAKIWQHFASKDASEIASRPTIEEMLLERYETAVKKGLIAKLDVQKLKSELDRQAEELNKLQQQVAARSSEPPEAELSKLLKAGDLDAALRLKSQQVEMRRKETANLPRDLYELGVIHELRFEWPQALAAFRESWELGHDPEHGFKYALFAANLNHHAEAIAAFEALLRLYKDPSDRAGTLNNLGNLYRANNRMDDAEKAYDEALDLRRKLANANPDAYLPDVATTPTT